MKYILVNYNFDPSWVLKETEDYLIYDRSDDPKYKAIVTETFDTDKVIHTENIGNVDYDRLSYIIDNYFNLPDIFLLAKSNLFKFITKEEWDKIKRNKDFTPILTQTHKTYMPVCFYDGNGMYNEVNNSWYLGGVPSRYFRDYNHFARSYALPTPEYLTFAPGGNYIVTKDRIHRYGRDFYIELRDLLGYCQLPGEAHFIERTYYQLWK